MKGTELLYNDLAKYYEIVYAPKKYKKESQKIKKLIEKFKKSNGCNLLDVACGTGKHISFFKKYFHCMGVDISEKMLEIARRNVPDVEFKKVNMVDMRLEKKFDILTCLFSSIGLVKTYENLRKTWKNFANHLEEGGVAIVEPWFFRPMHHQKYHFCPNEDIQIAKLIRYRTENNLAILDYHYLISEKGKKVRHYVDHTEFGIFDADITLQIMESSGFEAHQLSDKDTCIYDDQTFYIGIKR